MGDEEAYLEWKDITNIGETGVVKPDMLEKCEWQQVN